MPHDLASSLDPLPSSPRVAARNVQQPRSAVGIGKCRRWTRYVLGIAGLWGIVAGGLPGAVAAQESAAAADGAVSTVDAASPTAERRAAPAGIVCRVQGKVSTGDEQPLADVTVRLLPVGDERQRELRKWRGTQPTAAAETTTDASGRFLLEAPDIGFWRLELSRQGFAIQHYDLAPLTEDRVVPPAVLEPTAGISIGVKGADGRGLRARLIARRSEAAGTSLWSRGRWLIEGADWYTAPWIGSTDAKGRAVLPIAPSDGWVFEVVAAGHKPVEVPLADVRSIQLEPAVARPIAAAPVKGLSADGTLVYLEKGQLPIARTDADGLATVYLSSAEHALSWFGQNDQQADSVLPALPETTDEDVSVHTVQLESRDRVVGRVLEATERTPLPGALVWSWGVRGLRLTRSDRSGTYDLALSKASSLGLHAAAHGYVAIASPQSEPSPDSGDGPTLLLEAAGGLAGTVVDGDGKPVEGVLGRLTPSASSRRMSSLARRHVRALSDGLGNLQFRGLAAEQGFTLRLEKAGFAPLEIPVDALQKREVRRQQRWRLVPGYRGFGQIVDGDEQPVAGAEVRLEPSQSGRPNPLKALLSGHTADVYTTDGEGVFTTADLAPGRYDLNVSAAGFSDSVVRGIEVLEGSGDLDLGVLVLAPGFDVPGRVLDVERQPLADVEIYVSAGNDRMSRVFGMLTESEPVARSDRQGEFVVPDKTTGDQLTFTAKKEGFVDAVMRGVKVPTEEPVEMVLEQASGITGRVLDADGVPLEGVAVNAMPEDRAAARRARFSGGSPNLTDVEGRFELPKVRPGATRLQAQKTGFEVLTVGGFDVVAGQTLRDVELRMVQGAVLVGTLSDADDEPVAGTMIFVMRPGMTMVEGGYSQTDGDGAFRIDGLPIGQFTVAARGDGVLKASRNITIEAGENTVDLKFSNTVSVQGTVYDASGAGLQGAQVRLRPKSRSFLSGGLTVDSQADGTFELPDVPPGDYHLTAQKEGLGSRQLEEPLVVTDQPILGLELRLGGGIRVVGQILGLDFESLGRVTVTAYGSGSAEVTQPNFEGRYQIDHMLPGELSIRAQLGGSARSIQRQVTLEEGDVEVAVDLEFIDGLVLTGTVLKLDQPEAGVTVRLAAMGPGTGASTTTGSDGSFRIEGLEEGSYRLSIGGWDTSYSHEETLELSADEDIRIELEVARLRGRVVDGDGQGLANAQLVLDRDGARQQTAFSDSLGNFSFGEVSAGRWELNTKRSGYGGRVIEVELPSGESVEDVEVQLEPVRGIHLEVVLQDGRPVGAIHAAFVDSDGTSIGGTFQGDDQGLFVIDTVPGGNWQMMVAASGYGTTQQAVTVPREEPIRVALQPAGQLDIVVPALRDSGQGGVVELTRPSGEPFRYVFWGGRVEETLSIRGGQRRVEGLTSGTWTVRVFGDDGVTWQGSVTVQSGELQRLELN